VVCSPVPGAAVGREDGCAGFVPRHEREEDTMGERKAFEEKQQAELDEIEARLKKLQAEARQVKAEAKIEGYRWLDELEPKHQEAREKLDAFRRAGEASWEELKRGVEKATDNLRNAVDRASQKLGS
jgi:chromosome segregation ATPase